MFYFLPDWQQSENFWENTAEPWYRETRKIEFDDTINQLRMLIKSNQSSKMLILSYSPFLRSFLQRQDILGVNSFNAFDVIQGINLKYMRSLNFTDLNWPTDIEFSYTPFLVIARRQDQLYARIEFASNGRLLKIIRFLNDKSSETLLFDDRGFLSSLIYQNKSISEKQQTFFDLNGNWRIKVNYPAMNVEVNPNFYTEFMQKKYDNIEELIVEKFCQYLTKCFSKKDTLIVAAAERQINLVNKIDLPRKQVVFSFFAQRQDIDKQQIVKLTKKAATFIADTDKTVSQLNSISSHTDYPAEVVQISPFDSRLELGHSQQVKKLKILLLVNRLDISDQKPVLSELIKTMKQNQLIELVLVDYQNTQTYWKKVVQQVIQQQKAEDLFVFADQQQIVSKVKNENDFNSTKRKIIWCFLQSEEDVIRQLSDTRLVIDLAKEPDLFLQIASISAGIPQINQVKTSYVEDHKNGLIIKKIDQLKQAVNFYLVGLTNWNQALVYAAKRISEYSSKNLIKKWQKISKEAE